MNFTLVNYISKSYSMECCSLQVRTITARIASHKQARANIDSTLKALSSRRAMESSDLFFPCDERAVSASKKDFQHISFALGSLLKKAGSNFELGLTSTKVMTMPCPPSNQTKIPPHSFRSDLM